MAQRSLHDVTILTRRNHHDRYRRKVSSCLNQRIEALRARRRQVDVGLHGVQVDALEAAAEAGQRRMDLVELRDDQRGAAILHRAGGGVIECAEHLEQCGFARAARAYNRDKLAALYLKRKVLFDPVKNEFINDEKANRLRAEAIREPWRIG